MPEILNPLVVEKLYIQNYKSFTQFELEFTNSCNIIVGDNESGKSSILEALNLVLTGQLNGRNISYELTPYLFNKVIVDSYIQLLKDKKPVEPPKIIIEVYLKDTPELAILKGTINSKKEDAVGISMTIEFNEEFSDEYKSYIDNPEEIKTIPTEYFKIDWYSFSNKQMSSRNIPIKTTLIDTTVVRLQNGTDYYIQRTIDDILEKKERAGLSLLYRSLKEKFSEAESIKTLNERLKENKNLLSHRKMTLSLDVSHKSNWDSNLTSYLDEIPYQYIGKGDQNVLKMVLALERKGAKESSIILIEEPENHLSFTKMNALIDNIHDKCVDKQLIMTTHSTYVLNKLGIDRLILLGESKKTMTLNKLSPDTLNYFRKLPGYNTLRLVLAKKSILVEGPCDELIVQLAYKNKHGKLPIENGIDVITVEGLAFKRFLEIAKLLKKNVAVVTDNDGDIEAVEAKYKDFVDDKIHIYYDKDIECTTLEPQMLKVNSLELFNKIFNTKHKANEELLHFMGNNKTECALKIFESEEKINIPEYINDAIA